MLRRAMTPPSDSTKRFDAPLPPSTWADAVALVRARWSIAGAMVIAIAIVGALAFGLLFVDRFATALVDASVGATAVFVSVDPRASASDAEALGDRIRSLPGVADAKLRTRDEALRSLVANGLPPPEGRNPLPDVWTVRPKADGGDGRFQTVIDELRRALAALPLVESTKVDARWVERIDAGKAEVARGLVFGRSVGYTALGILLACMGSVGGQALTRGFSPRMSVLAVAVTLIGVGGLVVDAILIWTANTSWNPQSGSVIEATWRAVCSGNAASILSGAFAILLILFVFSAAARPRIDRQSR